jgi:hypothetical protein
LDFFLLFALARFLRSPVSLLELELLGESDESESSSMVTTSSFLRFFFDFPALREVCFFGSLFLGRGLAPAKTRHIKPVCY